MSNPSLKFAPYGAPLSSTLGVMKKHLFVGGLVAVGFDPSGQYLLTVSHAGRGVFAVGSWELVASDVELAYPKDGHAVGIGPMDGMEVPISELNSDTGLLHFGSPDCKYSFEYEEGAITVTEVATQHIIPPDLAHKTAQGR